MATQAEQRPQLDREELVVYGVLAAIGVIPVAISLLTHEGFGLDGTLGLLMLLVGLGGIALQVARVRFRRR